MVSFSNMKRFLIVKFIISLRNLGTRLLQIFSKRDNQSNIIIFYFGVPVSFLKICFCVKWDYLMSILYLAPNSRHILWWEASQEIQNHEKNPTRFQQIPRQYDVEWTTNSVYLYPMNLFTSGKDFKHFTTFSFKLFFKKL